MPSYVTLMAEGKYYIEASFHPETKRLLLLGEYDNSRALAGIPNKKIDIRPEDTEASVMGSIMGHIAVHVFDKGFECGKKQTAKDLIKKLGIDPKEL